MHFGATQKFKMTNDNQIQVYKTFVSSGYNNIIPILRLRYNPNANYLRGLNIRLTRQNGIQMGKIIS